MGRFLCVAALCALLAGGYAVRRYEAQPVFFSLLFPQLMPGTLFDPEMSEADAAQEWGAFFL